MRFASISIAAVIAIAGAVGGVFAHGGATGIVGDRMNGMMDMAQSVKTLSQSFAGGAFDPAVVRQAARVIEGHAGETMLQLFPEGSLDSPSVATPEIWTNWTEFSRLAIRLRQLAAELVAAADRGVSPPVPAPVLSGPAAPGDMWASLDERALLGLKPQPRVSTRATEAPAEIGPSPQALFAEITDACASCHAAFREAN